MSLCETVRLERLQIENRNLSYMLMIDLNDINVKDMLINSNISTIGIYGMNAAGRFLYQLMRKKGIDCIAIDQKVSSFNRHNKVYSSIDEWPAVDMFVVTGELYWEEIKAHIHTKSDKTVVKASEFLEEILSVPLDYKSGGMTE